MATWTDGAAYAPIERPDGFATPEAEPLEAAPPERAATPGPMAPPAGFAPMDNVIPLGAIRTEPIAQRDPQEPFEVSAALLTAEPGGSGPRDPEQPFQSFGTPGSDLPPPSGPPLALAPTGAPLAAPPPPGLPPASSASPATAGFNYPPPAAETRSPAGIAGPHPGFVPAANRQVQAQAMQLQTTATVLFGIGFLLWGASSFLLLVGGALFLRIAHRRNMAISALVTGGLTLMIRLIDLQDLTWVAPVACLVFFVWSLSNRRPPGPPAYRPPGS